jgi:hypothetical protein
VEGKNDVIEFWGSCNIKTSLKLEDVAIRVSKVLCGGLPFVYGKHSIWEEIPSMYIEHSILGMLIIVGGYGGDKGFEVAVWPYGNYSRYIRNNNLEPVKVRLDLHLYHLLKENLKDQPEIQIMEPENRA